MISGLVLAGSACVGPTGRLVWSPRGVRDLDEVREMGFQHFVELVVEARIVIVEIAEDIAPEARLQLADGWRLAG